MAEASPAFSFYARDFMVGSMAMTLEQRGAYITLLCYQWDAGSVPDDIAAIARILGCTLARTKALWGVVGAKFTHEAGGHRNHRLEIERAKQAERREQLAANGRKGGRPAKPNENQKDNQTETNRFSVGKANGNQNESLASAFASSVVQQEPPLPPSARGVTREERKWALAVIQAYGNQCPHGGECESESFCVGRLVRDRASDEQAGRKAGAA